MHSLLEEFITFCPYLNKHRTVKLVCNYDAFNESCYLSAETAMLSVLHLPQYGGILRLLDAFQSWFPALPSPYLRMLAALCNKSLTKDKASIFHLSSITLQHEKSDLRIHRVRDQLVEATRDVSHAGYVQILEVSLICPQMCLEQCLGI